MGSTVILSCFCFDYSISIETWLLKIISKGSFISKRFDQKSTLPKNATKQFPSIVLDVSIGLGMMVLTQYYLSYVESHQIQHT